MEKDVDEAPEKFKERDKRKLIRGFNFSWLENRLSNRFKMKDHQNFLGALLDAYQHDVFGCPKRSDFEEKFQGSLNERQLGEYSLLVPFYTTALYEWGVLDPCERGDLYLTLNNVWEEDIEDYLN
jgi:hypothetical protein